MDTSNYSRVIKNYHNQAPSGLATNLNPSRLSPAVFLKVVAQMLTLQQDPLLVGRRVVHPNNCPRSAPIDTRRGLSPEFTPLAPTHPSLAFRPDDTVGLQPDLISGQWKR